MVNFYIIDKYLNIKQATKQGYIECEIKDKVVVDLSLPTSKTRRGRVQDGGTICPTITTAGILYVIESV